MGGIGARILRNRNKANFYASQKFVGSFVNANGGVNVCFFKKETAPGPFAAVRMVALNRSAADMILTGAVVAATETAATDNDTNRYHPVLGGVAQDFYKNVADYTGWFPLLWAGAELSTGAPLTVPAPALNGETTSRSDWLPLRYIPRADAGETLPLTMTRTRFNNAAATTCFSAAQSLVRSAENKGRLIQGHFANDAPDVMCTAPEANSPAGAMNNTTGICYLEYALISQGVSVMGIGDSTVQGATIPTDKVSNWLLQACAIVSDELGIAVAPINYGYANQDIADYWFNTAKAALIATLPDIAIYQVWGHNDMAGIGTAALARVKTQAALGAAMDFIVTCRNYHVIPVLCLTFGDVNVNAAADAERVALNATLSGMGARIIDFSPINNGLTICDTATPQRLLATFNNGDNIHPNIAGIAVQGIIAGMVLRDIVLSQFYP